MIANLIFNILFLHCSKDNYLSVPGSSSNHHSITKSCNDLSKSAEETESNRPLSMIIQPFNNFLGSTLSLNNQNSKNINQHSGLKSSLSNINLAIKNKFKKMFSSTNEIEHQNEANPNKSTGTLWYVEDSEFDEYCEDDYVILRKNQKDSLKNFNRTFEIQAINEPNDEYLLLSKHSIYYACLDKDILLNPSEYVKKKKGSNLMALSRVKDLKMPLFYKIFTIEYEKIKEENPDFQRIYFYILIEKILKDPTLNDPTKLSKIFLSNEYLNRIALLESLMPKLYKIIMKENGLENIMYLIYVVDNVIEFLRVLDVDKGDVMKQYENFQNDNFRNVDVTERMRYWRTRKYKTKSY